ncbi:MAG: glycoside hydrolase family 92 protein, partial [Bacteroidales bacterium]
MRGTNKQLVVAVSVTGLILSSCAQNSIDPVSCVNPYIGNISHLLVPTYPTVHIPNSMVRFYPERDNFTTNKMQGFPLNVVSHRGGKAFLLVPFTGIPEGIRDMPFTFDNETITPYSYSVTLDESDIDVK